MAAAISSGELRLNAKVKHARHAFCDCSAKGNPSAITILHTLLCALANVELDRSWSGIRKSLSSEREGRMYRRLDSLRALTV